MEKTNKWFRKLYNKAIHSIAFFPALIVLCFLGLAILVLKLDASGVGEEINRQVAWLTLKDATTATTIVATVAAGIISLMVFSFSMVMVVMTQAASQMSNRLLDNFIGGRFQKMVLSFYIGTIVFAFLLLSNSSEAEEVPVPVLSIYTLILLAIIDIFLFVSFLHFITQSIRYEQLIQGVHKKAQKSLSRYAEKQKATDPVKEMEGKIIPAKESGYYQAFDTSRLLRLCTKENITIRFLHVKGEYVLRGTPLFVIQAAHEISPSLLDKVFAVIDFYYGQETDKNPYYGFLHLMETGVKALSPGINDPGTAVLSLNALADLLAYKMEHQIPAVFCDKSGIPRIITKEWSFEELFSYSVLPVWDYGRKDRTVQNALLRLLRQLQQKDASGRYGVLFESMIKDVKAAQAELPCRL
jgi:uncharacterized membrane protein